MAAKERNIPFSHILAYLTVSGCLWHLGYWSTFRFNYLEFASIIDVFKSTVYPFLSHSIIFLALLLPFIAMSIFNMFILSDDVGVKNISKKKLAIIGSILGGLTFIFSGLLFKNKFQLDLLPFLVGMLLATLLYTLGFFEHQIKHSIGRLTFLIAFALFPALNYGIAKKQALQIKYNFKYKKVENIISSDSLLGSKLETSRYLGSTRDYYFFYYDKGVYIVRQDQISSFTLREIYIDSNYRKWENYISTSHRAEP